MTMLETRLRHDRNGVPCVAPFIDGWNVWDIPVAQWTEPVQKAILHAYELGWRHCHDAHVVAIASVHSASLPIGATFPQP